jgi:cation transport ATPase
MRHVIAITGMIDASAVQSVEAAVRGIDPAAQIDVSLQAGLVSVDSDSHVAAFCAAIEARGLIAEPTERVMTRTPQLLFPDEAPVAARGTVVSLILRALLWGIAWFFITVLIYFVPVLMIGFLCNCNMDLITLPVVAAIVGAIIAFVTTLALGVRRRRRSDVQDE